jgi:hypothetical protein
MTTDSLEVKEETNFEHTGIVWSSLIRLILLSESSTVLTNRHSSKVKEVLSSSTRQVILHRLCPIRMTIVSRKRMEKSRSTLQRKTCPSWSVQGLVKGSIILLQRKDVFNWLFVPKRLTISESQYSVSLLGYLSRCHFIPRYSHQLQRNLFKSKVEYWLSWACRSEAETLVQMNLVEWIWALVSHFVTDEHCRRSSSYSKESVHYQQHSIWQP